MKVGDLVRHREGEVGIIINIDWSRPPVNKRKFPYHVLFLNGTSDWFSDDPKFCGLELVSESR